MWLKHALLALHAAVWGNVILHSYARCGGAAPHSSYLVLISWGFSALRLASYKVPHTRLDPFSSPLLNLVVLWNPFFLFLFICWKAPGQVNTIYQGGFSISNAFCQGSFAYPLVFFFPGRVVRVDKRGNIKGRAPHAEGGAESAECVVNSADQSKRRVLASCGSRTYRFHGAREEIGARAEASASLSCPKLFPQWLGVGDDTSLALPPRI